MFEYMFICKSQLYVQPQRSRDMKAKFWPTKMKYSSTISNLHILYENA